MNRNICKRIEEIKGTKSTKIMELINRKLQLRKNQMLEKHTKDVKLNRLYNSYKETKDKAASIKALLETRKDELDLTWSGYGDDRKYQIKTRCRISQEDYNTLQNAQDLYSLGKRQQATDIWEKIIKKHSLMSMMEK